MRSVLIALSAAGFAAASVAPAADASLDIPAIRSELIDAVNNDPTSTWTAGVNSKFSGMTRRQAKRLMGAKRDPARFKALLERSDPIHVPAALPASFNSTQNWPQCASVIGHIRDQSDCGCCWAFASTESFNDRLCIVHNVTALMSVGQTCACVTDGGCSGCDGGFGEGAWESFIHTGCVTGGDNPSTGSGSSCFPFPLQMCDHHEGGPYTPCPNVCSGGECPTPTCPNNKCTESKYPVTWSKDLHFGKKYYAVSGVNQIMAEIVANGPVYAAFTVYDDFLTYTSGVYTHKTGQELGGHAVKIYGYGTENGVDYWLVANSWNNYWGANGSFKILRGKDECGIESNIVAGTV